jgi:hypothetical protein
MTEKNLRPWRKLGSVDPLQLKEVRLQVHWAAQLASSFADDGLERLPDDSQSNLGWQDDLEVLRARQRADGLAAGLRPVDLTLLVFDASGKVADALPLAGRTLDEGLSWLGELTASPSGGAPIQLRGHSMPNHPTASGSPFVLQPEPAYSELARWFANGNAALEVLASSQPGWAEVRCWPHHFDLGTLVSIEASNDPSSGRSIGVGMSPGDDSYAEPYFYVNPYGLQSTPSALPALPPAAHWHTTRWFGAVLTGSALLESDDPEANLAAFLDSAVAVMRGLVKS